MAIVSKRVERISQIWGMCEMKVFLEVLLKINLACHANQNKTESKFSPRPRANPFCNLFKSIQLLPVLSNSIYNQPKTLINTKICLLHRKI